MEAGEWIFDYALAQRRERLCDSGYDVYCLYCKTGFEIEVASEINEKNESLITLPFLRLMHKSRNGERKLAQEALLKGYVFIYAPLKMDISSVETARYVYSILGRATGTGTLIDNDLKYAKWVLSLGGVVGISKALRVNEKVKIIAGPLLDFEGSIKDYSKKNRNCRVQIDIVGQQLSVWLPFDWVESERGMLDIMELEE